LNDRVMNIVEGIEARQVAPAMARVNAILDDVKVVSTKVKDESERVDRAIRSTIDRVDTTADRVRSNVRANTSWLVGAVRGLRVVVDGLMNSDRRSNRAPNQPASDPTERVM
jgi:ABC-type transporter Mla subunit MlaD